MASNSGARRQQVRLFRNERLERLSRVSPAGFAVTWTVVLAAAIRISWGVVILPVWFGLVAGGLVAWSLFEYGMHRFVFHWKPASKFGQWAMFLAHGNHHVAPADPARNLMPPAASLAINGSVWVLFWLMFGRTGSVLFVGFAIGYMIYDSVHYACHQLPMRGRFWRRLRRHHSRHHYIDQDGNYAITAIFWDRVFGTHVAARQRSRGLVPADR
jgi:sterol desaturase/sphingolipid hydroxylase (fatty acid hydroxylase superfamily)